MGENKAYLQEIGESDKMMLKNKHSETLIAIYKKHSMNIELCNTVNQAEGLVNKVNIIARHFRTHNNKIDEMDMDYSEIERCCPHTPYEVMGSLFISCFSRKFDPFKKDRANALIYKYIVFLIWMQYYTAYSPYVVLGEISKKTKPPED